MEENNNTNNNVEELEIPDSNLLEIIKKAGAQEKLSQDEVNKLLKDAKADNNVLALKSFEALQNMANGQATKIIVPSDLQGIASLGITLSEIAKNKK